MVIYFFLCLLATIFFAAGYVFRAYYFGERPGEPLTNEMLDLRRALAEKQKQAQAAFEELAESKRRVQSLENQARQSAEKVTYLEGLISKQDHEIARLQNEVGERPSAPATPVIEAPVSVPIAMAPEAPSVSAGIPVALVEPTSLLTAPVEPALDTSMAFTPEPVGSAPPTSVTWTPTGEETEAPVLLAAADAPENIQEVYEPALAMRKSSHSPAWRENLNNILSTLDNMDKEKEMERQR